jgi:hypothetical protein
LKQVHRREEVSVVTDLIGELALLRAATRTIDGIFIGSVALTMTLKILCRSRGREVKGGGRAVRLTPFFREKLIRGGVAAAMLPPDIVLEECSNLFQWDLFGLGKIEEEDQEEEQGDEGVE